MLLQKSAEYWARRATIDELHDEASAITSWTDEQAEVLDFAYVDRSARLIERTRAESKGDAVTLADHIELIAHDSQRDALDALERPYFARWRLLIEMLHRCAERLEVPHTVLARKHVLEILRRVMRAGGRVGQGELDGLIRNPGQLSSTLKMLETWDLVERVVGPANTRIVTLTDLGRLALGTDSLVEGGDEPAAQVAPPAKRFIAYMSATGHA